jgi:hypothetical protein
VENWIKSLERIPNSRIIIGDNYHSTQEFSNCMLSVGNDYHKCTLEGHINSDASGFMECLKALGSNFENDDLIWFAHTKGFSHDINRINLFFEYYNDKWFRFYDVISERFINNNNLGLLCERVAISNYGEHIINSYKLKELLHLRYPPLGFYALNTFYVMRGSVVKFLFNNESILFKYPNIVDCLGFNRWFFEANVPEVAWMSGFDVDAFRSSPDYQAFMDFKSASIFSQKAEMVPGGYK